MEVGNGIKIGGGLLASKSTVEVGTDSAVIGVARELADVIGVVEEVFEFELFFFRGGLPSLPPRNHHPRIQTAADDGSAFNQEFDLFVRELSIVRNESAAIGVAGPDGAVKVIERLAETVIAEMGGIENEIKMLHFRQQFATARPQTTSGVRALGIGARSVVGGAQGS